VKPLRLAASRGVIRVDDSAALTAAFARIGRILAEATGPECGVASRHVLVEQYVPGREVALEGLISGGTLSVLALFDKPDPLTGPFFEESIYVTPSRLDPAVQQQVAAVAQQAVTAIGLHQGPVHVELRINADGPWLIEIAARPIGGRCSAALRFGDNVSLEEIVIRHALHLPLQSLAREAQTSGVIMIPVPRAGTLREVRGVERARAVPLVTGVDITAHPGEHLVPWPEGSRYPGFIYARGETPAQVEAALRAAHTCLEFILEPPNDAP
jgi:biotin carboxylase